MSRVTIVIPCFNDGVYLAESIASALGQDHDDCEVVVADDGSTDRATVAALEAAERQGVHVLRRPHLGVSSTRNAAIAAASGEYILPLDADDLLAPTFASEASAVLDEQIDVGIVGAATEFFGTRSGTTRPTPTSTVAWLLANQLPVSAAFRRADWERCGGYAEDLGWGEDWHFWVKVLALERRVSVLPSVGLFYRRRPGQVTSHVPWDVQQIARARVLQAGLPIINRHPEEATAAIASQLNQLQAVRQRRSERVRTWVKRRWPR